MEAAETVETGSPLIIEHTEGRVLETPQPESGVSELEQHKIDRGLVKPEKREPEPPPMPEAAKEEKKPERWQDPDTGDHYDMRHKVARRIKTVLEDRGKERARAEAAERRVEELTRTLIERGAPPVRAEKTAQATVDADPEPDPSDTAKYPEGQFDKAFVRDMGRWAARQETTAQFTKAGEAAQQQRQQAAEVAAVTRWQETLPSARQRYPDFDQALGSIPNTPENAPIVRMMMGSPVGNDIVYVLGTNQDARRAYDTAPNHESRQRLLYHIEAQLIQAHRAAQKKEQPPATTTAPPPTTPVHTGAGPAGPNDWSKDDPDQFQRWKSQRGNRR